MEAECPGSHRIPAVQRPCAAGSRIVTWNAAAERGTCGKPGGMTERAACLSGGVVSELAPGRTDAR